MVTANIDCPLVECNVDVRKVFIKLFITEMV